MIKLSSRLDAIASFVDTNTNVLDIGTDHAFLPIYLSQTKKSINIIASDINDHALMFAKKNIEKEHITSIIDVRLGNGLEVIKQSDKIDTIVMSGMGSRTIIKILKEGNLDSIETIIIQSNTDLYYLRKEMIKLKYYIAEEKIVKENNLYYVIIKYKKGYKRYNYKQLYLGPMLINDNCELFQEYKHNEYQKNKIIYKLIPKHDYKTKLKLFYKKLIFK